MPTRRTFLQASMAATFALPAARVAASAPALLPPRIAVDRHCADTALFAAQCADVVSIGDDPAAVLSALSDQHSGRDPVFGLSRASQQFLIEHLAGEHGYRVVYRGVHDYRSGSLRHALSGPAALMPGFAHALRTSAAQWPVMLAGGVSLLARSTAIEHTSRIAGAVPRPADSAGYLVSWCLRPVWG